MRSFLFISVSDDSLPASSASLKVLAIETARMIRRTYQASSNRRCPLSLSIERSREIKKSLAVATLMALLSGCSVGPDFTSPAVPAIQHYLPDKQVNHDGLIWGADVSAQWWKNFGSESLNRLIEAGIAHNPDLEAAEAALRLAQTNIIVQRAAFFPSISANLNPTRQRAPSDILSAPTKNGKYLYSLHTGQVTVSFSPDIWGGTRRQIENVEAQARAAAFQREAAFLSLTANIASAAVQEASLRGQIAATERLIALQAKLLDLLHKQYAAGQIAQTDVVVQETAVAQTKLLLPPLRRALIQQRNLLATLTGRMPGEGVKETFSLQSFRLPRKIPLTLPADLVRNRPDIRVAEENLRAANALIGVAIANRLPQISLTANAGSSAGLVERLFSPGRGIWALTGNLTHTIFDAGALAARQEGAEEATLQASAQYRSTVLNAFQNVADTLGALQNDTQALSAAVAAERMASRSMDLVRKQVEAGHISLSILLNTQQAYLQATLALIQVKAQRTTDTIALFQALGGGWWNRPGPLVPNLGAMNTVVAMN